MQSDNKIFEDFVKMANGFAGTMAGAAREGETAFKEKVKAWVGGMDFVSREEFEAVKAMAAAARETLSLADDMVFGSEISFALYLFPLMFGGIGVNIISHVLVTHLVAAEKRFAREHPDEQ